VLTASKQIFCIEALPGFFQHIWGFPKMDGSQKWMVYDGL
jgi:hypothetical protein